MSEDAIGFLPPIVVTSVARLHPGAKGGGSGGGGNSFLQSSASAPVVALLGKLNISDDSIDDGSMNMNGNINTINNVGVNDDEDKIRAGIFVLDKTYVDDFGHSLGIDGVQSSGSSANSTPATSSQSRRSSGSAGASASSARKPRKPISMQRAKQWSPDVENAFRYQLAGFKDSEEYLTLPDNSQPEYWLPEGLIKCLRSKKTGYFMYFRRTRECEDKFLNRIILYQY